MPSMHRKQSTIWHQKWCSVSPFGQGCPPQNVDLPLYTFSRTLAIWRGGVATFLARLKFDHFGRTSKRCVSNKNATRVSLTMQLGFVKVCCGNTVTFIKNAPSLASQHQHGKTSKSHDVGSTELPFHPVDRSMSAKEASRHILRSIKTHRTLFARNSLLPNGQREALSTENRDILKWYSCGPTVYDDAHLGHARAYVSFDIIRRIISSLSATPIDYALGITDIDDKILRRSAEQSKSPLALARTFETRFFEDMRELNVLPPSKILRVTEHISELQQIIQDLLQNQSAYVAESGNVYFAVSSTGKRYAQLDPSRSLSNEMASSQTEPQHSDSTEATEKRDQRDFALWKRSANQSNELSWVSPWGAGRPGWHVECSAMAMAALGTTLDLHTGGIDLRFPHHTNELATAEARMCLHTLSTTTHQQDGPRWSHSWLHAGHLHMHGRKMSKSIKNFVTVREFLQQGGTADGFRIFCLLHRYSSPVEYTEQRLTDAHNYLSRIRKFASRDMLSHSLLKDSFNHNEPALSMHPGCEIAASLRSETRRIEDEIDKALTDDFDTPRALASIAQLVRASNSVVTPEGLPKSGPAALAHDAARMLTERTFDMLGVTPESLRKTKNLSWETEQAKQMESLLDRLVQFRSDVRNAARQKDYAGIFDLCDSVRGDLKENFRIRVADRKDGIASWAKE